MSDVGLCRKKKIHFRYDFHISALNISGYQYHLKSARFG